MISILGAGLVISYGLIYSGVAALKGTPISTLQALWPKKLEKQAAGFMPKPSAADRRRATTDRSRAARRK